MGPCESEDEKKTKSDNLEPQTAQRQGGNEIIGSLMDCAVQENSASGFTTTMLCDEVCAFKARREGVFIL